MQRKFLHLSLVVLIAVSAFAQEERAPNNAPGVERLRAHITYLASDKLEGRRTGSRGADLAAEYIAGEFSRYGLKRSVGVDRPGMSILEADSPRRYMQEFPFVAGVELGKENAMFFSPRAATGASRASEGARLAPLDLSVGEEWMPLGFSSSGRAAATEVVFAGYGITAADLKYDDYAGLDVKGRIVLVLPGTPDGDNPHGEFARYADARWKAIAAREHGAAALVVIAREESFKDDPLSRLRYDNSAGDAGLQVAAISRTVAGRILASAGLSPLAELEKAARAARSTASGNNGRNSSSAGPLQGITLSIQTDVKRRNAQAANVVGILEGSDPVLKNEAIVIGAHYDHLGLGGEGSLAPREGEAHHGADDNASGVAGMLELARIFSLDRPRLKRTLVFIAFSGEEEGLLGSHYYVNHPVVPLAQTVAMINLDMIGRMKDDRLIVGGVGTAQEWRALVEKINDPVSTAVAAERKDERNLSLRRFALTLNEDGYGPSDHASFYSKQVPVLFFWTGTHEDYHKPSDTADKINYQDEARIISLVADIARSVGEGERRPAYMATARSESTGRSSMSFRVSLGTIPNYADSTTGLTLDGVRDDSPASRAGLKAGDRIVRLAGRDVRNVYDYTYALGEMKAGEVYEVEIVRAGQTLKLKITPVARK
ncbi:MAG: M20/M25/M40 family metallo-hydrolase [Pyrinomonadaceae bacterium]